MQNSDFPNINAFLPTKIRSALKRAYPHCKIVDNFQSLRDCVNRDFISLQISSCGTLHKLIWEKIRIEWQKLSPIIVLGYRLENDFLSRPENLVFVERLYEYRYLSMPLSLSKFLSALSNMQPIYDQGTLLSHIRRYASTNGLLRTHLHHISNYVYRHELSKCASEFEKINRLLLMSSGGDITAEIESFIQNPNKTTAIRIRDFVYGLIDD